MNHRDRLYRVVTFLNRKSLEFLDSLIKDVYFDYGIKISRAKLIKQIVDSLNNKGSEEKKSIEQSFVKSQ